MSEKRQLVEMLYPGDLPFEVADQVKAGVSWRGIAAKTNEGLGRTGVHVKVSHEILRQWYGAAVTTP